MRGYRSLFFLAPLLVALAYGCSSDPAGPGSPNTGTGGDGASAGGGPDLKDSDGDGISDVDEEAALGTDTDSDGTPDYLDTDSDDDGISDSIEAGDSQLGTPPVDSDDDGVADFRDIDSDGNKIPDKVEGADDTDADGIGDYADGDNDGDNASDSLEIVGAGMDCDGDLTADAEGSPEAPADCDADGTPNYMDADSDGDTISDLTEGSSSDTDGDKFLDRYDLDSDNDKFSDTIEAGDEDIGTPPVDTDEDGTPDYLDPDSDQDGLSDLKEYEEGTDPKKEDTDGDGVSDLIEVAAGTDPKAKDDNPQAHGDFVFVVPYDDTTTPPEDTLEFRTSVQFADIYFLFDETGSMGAEFTAMKNQNSGVPKIISELRCNDFMTACLIDSDCPGGQVCFNKSCIEDPITANNGDGCIPDMWTGVGRYNNCNTYKNTLHLQSNPSATASAIGNTGPGGTESVVQSPACVADPSFCSNNNQCSADASVANPVGCPGYRPDAVRILVSITDADNQGGTCGGKVPSLQTTGNALKNAGIKFVGLYGTGDDGGGSLCTTPKKCAEQIGTAAGTVDKNNQPFAYAALNAQVVDATKKAVLELVRGVPLNVTIEATDQEGDAGDALQFINYLEVNVSGQGSCTNVTPTADNDMDGYQDAFPQLLGGTPVCWDVHPVDKQKTVMPTDEPQLFLAKLTVSGDGSPLDARDVYFLVPPKEATIPPPPN